VSPLQAIARSAGVGRDALRRHAASHLPGELAALREAGQKIEHARALDRLEQLFAEGNEVLAAARAEGRHQMSLVAIRELRAVVELIARLTGELDDRPDVVVNIASSAEWLQVQTVIVGALEPYPDARQAVAEALAPLGAA
jgi:hypothetical protein